MKIHLHRLALFLFLAIGLTQCQTKTKSGDLFAYLNSKYKNRFDVKPLIGYKPVLHTVIKKDKALLIVTNGPGKSHDSTFFIIVDIPQNRIINTIKSPIEPYYNVRADLNGDSVFCFGDHKPEHNYVININTGQARDFDITDTCISIPVNIIAFDKFILHHSLYGSSIANLTTGKTTLFKNSFISNQDAISTPLNSSINLLLSGYSLKDDSTSLIALNNMGAEVWNSRIKVLDKSHHGVKHIDIFRIDNRFIVRNSSQLLAIDARSGKQLWHKTFPPYTTKALLWNKKLLIYTFIDDELFPCDGCPQKINLKLIEPATGNTVWDKNIVAQFPINIAPLKNDLVMSSYRSLKVMNEKGMFVLDTLVENSNEYIEPKIDQLTGKNYLLYNGTVFYW